MDEYESFLKEHWEIHMLNEKELALIGKAFYAVGKRDSGQQDARGWNKCMDAIWAKYLELTDGSKEE